MAFPVLIYSDFFRCICGDNGKMKLLEVLRKIETNKKRVSRLYSRETRELAHNAVKELYHRYIVLSYSDMPISVKRQIHFLESVAQGKPYRRFEETDDK